MNKTKSTKSIRHVRYIEEGMVYHVVSKTLRGEFFLSPVMGVAELCAGIVAKAQLNNPDVKLYGFAFMSNHIHLMLSGRGGDVSKFMGFIKREISKKLGKRYRKRGTFWHKRFDGTALPTAESREKSLRYILSQGVKEDLVERPEHWPGLHCAKHLKTGAPIRAEWFDGTAYQKERVLQSRRKRKKRLNSADYLRRLELKVSPLPEWESLSEDERRKKVADMIEDVVQTEAERRRLEGKQVLGRKWVRRVPISISVAPPDPPWWGEGRRRITSWARRAAIETRVYLTNYWNFQRSFRDASEDFRTTGKLSGFPPGSFAPSIYLA